MNVKRKYTTYTTQQLQRHTTFTAAHNTYDTETSRHTVVSREAKKGQSDRQKQNARRTTVCRSASTFKPALKTQNLLANINYHPKDQSNQLSSLSFPVWSTVPHALLSLTIKEHTGSLAQPDPFSPHGAYRLEIISACSGVLIDWKL